MSAEIEETLKRIQGHAGVEGYVIVNDKGEVLRRMQTLSTADATTFGTEVYTLAQKARHVVRDLDPTNDLQYFRLRTRDREVLVAPGDGYMILVIQQWKPSEWSEPHM